MHRFIQKSKDYVTCKIDLIQLCEFDIISSRYIDESRR